MPGDHSYRVVRISDLQIGAVASLAGSPTLGLQPDVGIWKRKADLAQSVPAVKTLLRPSEEAPESGCGQEAGNSETDWPSVFATQMWVLATVMPEGPSKS